MVGQTPQCNVLRPSPFLILFCAGSILDARSPLFVDPRWTVILGAAGFAVGIALLGSRTIDTVGNKLSALTPSKSFGAQIGAAIVVLGSSALGLPV